MTNARLVGLLVLAASGIASVAGPGGTGALQAQEEGATFRGDATLRPGFHGLWRSDRDGRSSETHDLRVRAQLGGWWTPWPTLAFRGRLAGRFSTEQQTVRLYLDDHVPATDGLRLGEATVDELHLRWRPSDRIQLRAGRMQTAFELAGVPRKSLDRNDSPNTDITWTDGVHATLEIGGGWRQHLILQRNAREGPTNVVRGPLDFSDSRSRMTVFASLQSTDRAGPFIQREIDITFIPGAVPRPDEEGDRGHYVAAVVRGAVEPPIHPLGGRLVLAGEAGLATGTPARTLLRTGGAGDGDGTGGAFQLSANLMGIGERHSVGIVHARAGDGWLLSSDIRDNNREVEARYYWQYTVWGRLDVRFRYREDARMRVDTVQRRRDRDIYVRTTLRF